MTTRRVVCCFTLFRGQGSRWSIDFGQGSRLRKRLLGPGIIRRENRDAWRLSSRTHSPFRCRPSRRGYVLLDVGRIAPCMPGAGVLAVNGDEADAGDSTLVSIHTLLERRRPPGSVRPLAAARSQRQTHRAVRRQPRSDDHRRQRTATSLTRVKRCRGRRRTQLVGRLRPPGEYVTGCRVSANRPGGRAGESPNAFKFVVIPVLKRVLPIAAVGAALTVIIRRLARRKSS